MLFLSSTPTAAFRDGPSAGHLPHPLTFSCLLAFYVGWRTGQQGNRNRSQSLTAALFHAVNLKMKNAITSFFLIRVATEAQPYNLQAIKLIYRSCQSIPYQTFEGNFKGEADLIG